VQPLWKKIWRLLKNLNIDLPYDPAIPLLGIYPKECNTGYSRGTCTPIFIAALFTIAKLWKQSRCPTTDEWIKKMWHLYTMEFYSAMKKNEILSFAGNWMEFGEHHSERGQQSSEDQTSYVLPLMQTLDLGQI
jgi:hypothetical protein